MLPKFEQDPITNCAVGFLEAITHRAVNYEMVRFATYLLIAAALCAVAGYFVK